MTEETKSRFWRTAKRWLKALDTPLTFILVLAGFATLYFAAVDWRVRTIVKEPEFIAKVARQARPALVFDADGRLLADMGALQYLETVPSVEAAPEGEDGYHTKITVQPKEFLPTPPVLEALDIGSVSVEAKRGKALAWEIRLGPRDSLIAIGTPPQPVSSARYRLEIVPPY